jgi:glutamyl-Q tRNA(Asp) synthetase
MIPTFRFAPSPNGQLHLGHAYSALLNAELARRHGGRFLLRMEDIDITRCMPALAEECLRDLAWLGLQWEPDVRVQSQHWDDYRQALDALKASELVYPCFCSRSEVAKASHAQDPDGAPLYPGTCLNLTEKDVAARMAAGRPHSWRLRMDNALRARPGPHRYQRFFPATGQVEDVTADPVRWGDAIMARREIPTSYHLSVVVDDALQQVTHVVRGTDLEAATCLHVLLQALLGLPSPLYHHHALITVETGEKLSKSKGSESLASLRMRGVTPQQVCQMLGRIM